MLLTFFFMAGAETKFNEKLDEIVHYIDSLSGIEKRKAVQFMMYLLENKKEITLPLKMEEEKDFKLDPNFSKSMAHKAFIKLISDIIEKEFKDAKEEL